MLEDEILVWKPVAAVDAQSTGTVALHEVAALDHEVRDLEDTKGRAY